MTDAERERITTRLKRAKRRLKDDPVHFAREADVIAKLEERLANPD